MKNWKELYADMLSVRSQWEKFFEYEAMPWYKKIFCRKVNKPTATCRDLAVAYTKAFSNEHRNMVKGYNGEYCYIKMMWQYNLFLPTLMLVTYDGSCFGIETLRYDENGNARQQPCPYPYSECGVKGRLAEQYMPDGTDKVYAKFDNLCNEVSISKEWYKEISDGVPEKYRDFVHDCQYMWSDNVFTPLTVTHIKYDLYHKRYIIRFSRIIKPSEYHWVFQLIEQIYTPYDGNTTIVMPNNLQIVNGDICTIFKINGVADYIGQY